MWIKLTIVSPSKWTTKRKTPWAAGCCGPKLSVKFLIFVKNKLSFINYFFILQGLLNWKTLKVWANSTGNILIDLNESLYTYSI